MTRPNGVFSRRGILFLTASAVASAVAGPARALIEIDVNRGNVQPLPIAVPSFVGAGQDAQLGVDIANIVATDLKRSGLFAPIAQASLVQKTLGPSEATRLGDWKVINAQALVAGAIARQPDGRLRADFRLWDVFSSQQMI